MYAPCEVCGKRESEFLASIEGAKLNSCYSCAKVGRIIRSLDSQEGGSSPTPPDSTNSNVPFAFREEDKIIDGYGIIIRDARRAKNLRREEVAKEINEKESF